MIEDKRCELSNHGSNSTESSVTIKSDNHHNAASLNISTSNGNVEEISANNISNEHDTYDNNGDSDEYNQLRIPSNNESLNDKSQNDK